MAFGAKKIFPIDQRPSTAIGVSIPFDSPSVFFSTYTTKDAIRNNLINFFLTEKNEAFLNVNFGAGLRTYIFEQLVNKTTEFIQQDVQTQINQYFPDVKIINLNVESLPDYNEIVITIDYDIINTGMRDQIQLTFS